jgi:hypothetical protein
MDIRTINAGWLAAWVLTACASAVSPARAGAAAGGGHHGHHGGAGWVGGGSIGIGFGGGFGFGFGAVGIPVPWPVFVPVFTPVVVERGVLGGPMPQADPLAPPLVPNLAPRAPALGRAPAPIPAPGPARVRRGDGAKARQLVTIGDRLFRAGNLRKAAERYEQARRADPDAALPRVHLAQVALVRGQFAEAAALLREAVDAEPGWVTNARDIQSVYAEPDDFARQIRRLESRVTSEPADRDAWFVLGVELYLSGQTRRAADVFVRLTDRKPDSALASFLAATDSDPPHPDPEGEP